MKSKWLKIYLITTFWITFTSCSSDHIGPDNKNTAQCLADTLSIVSFSRHIQPIFTTHCATSGCHSGTNPKANLNLEEGKAYTSLMRPGWGYVDTLDPAGSLLYSAMTSTTNPMPPSGRLSNCDTKLVLKWIEQKAKNN
ncbi:MAG: hypothetical protein NZ529_08140 [Cytophagaceae bacterium]|nr:hypothetical protein [Cytophagaceae bacterium]MDW8456752.1 hypothetical protein [Cytophagaceae bacterium]